MNQFTLCHGDAVETMKGFESSSIDFIFADPPYFLSNDGMTVRNGKFDVVNKGEWDRSAGFDADVTFHRTWIAECLRVLKPNGTLAISGTYHSVFICGYLVQEFGCRVINDIIWFKPNGAPALGRRNFTASHETVLWVSKGKNAKHFFDYESSRDWDDAKDTLYARGKQMRSAWSIATTPKSEKSEGHHPTQKPLRLLRRLVALCTREGDLILDPFCGSGTTGVAALQLKRRFIGIDENAQYIALASKRLEKADETDAIIS